MATKKVKQTFSIGLDLGGTKLAGALIRNDGTIVESIKVPLGLSAQESPARSQKRVLNILKDVSLDLKKRYPLEVSSKYFSGLGLASAGPLNVDTGTLLFPANFPGWKKVPVRDLLQKNLHTAGFKTTVYFQNDAIAAALAEKWVGAAKDYESFAVVTIGTGIGTGVIFQNRPCQTKGMGSEFGHLLVDLPPVQNKVHSLTQHTVEGIASGTGLLRRARERGFAGTSVEELVASGQHPELFKDMSWALAALCYNLSMGFHLDGILVSGGLIKIKHLFFNEMKKNYLDMVRERNPLFATKIQIAKTDTKAGLLGAAYLPYLSQRSS